MGPGGTAHTGTPRNHSWSVLLGSRATPNTLGVLHVTPRVTQDKEKLLEATVHRPSVLHMCGQSVLHVCGKV